MTESVANGKDTWQELFDTLPEGKNNLQNLGNKWKDK